jgi:hypothetical protein
MRMIVAIEHDQARVSCRNAATFSKIFDRAGGATTAENHRVLLDAARQSGIDAASPTSQDLAIARALDVENEPTRPVSRARARGTPFGTLGQHVPKRSLPLIDCHPDSEMASERDLDESDGSDPLAGAGALRTIESGRSGRYR